jgi:hypothetical protein
MVARCEANRLARSIDVFGRPTSSWFELAVALIGAPIKLAAASFLGAVELAATRFLVQVICAMGTVELVTRDAVNFASGTDSDGN